METVLVMEIFVRILEIHRREKYDSVSLYLKVIKTEIQKYNQYLICNSKFILIKIS